MSYALMLSPCLSLGLDLQCFTRDGIKIHRYTLSEISSATHDFEAVLHSHESFSRLRDPTNICFIYHLLKNFQNFSFNKPDSSYYSIVSPSRPRQEI